MKKFLSIFLSLLIVIGTFGFTVAATTEASGTWGDLSWTIDTNGTLTISGEGDMKDFPVYDSLEDKPAWLSYTNSIRAVVIKSGVKSIGHNAFMHCYLESITIPNSITSIGALAFFDTHLKSINIPNSVTSIGTGAFEYCLELSNIVIDDSVTSIGEDAFYLTAYYNNENNWENDVLYIGNVLIEAKNVSEHYTIKDGTRLIADAAFDECEALTSVTIPNSVTSIGSSAFSFCKSLTSVFIPDGVTSIGGTAFFWCESLNDITIPNSVTSIGGSAFTCTAYYNDGNNWEKSALYGGLYIGNILIEAHVGDHYTIKDGTRLIADYAFYDCEFLKSVTIPDSVKIISSGAFSDCYELKTVNMGYGVTTIGNWAFCETNLTEITIPDSVTSIGEGAFYHCYALTNVTIPDSVTSIGYSAFEGCTALKSVKIPDSVKIIDDYTFYGCADLTSVTVPDGITRIGYAAFYHCESLKNITIPDGVTSIGDYAFNTCTSLRNIKIPDSVSSIGMWAFFSCTTLTNITIPDSVTSIGLCAFAGCSDLTINVVLSNKNYADINGVLYDKDKTTLIQLTIVKPNGSYTIPKGVVSIGMGAFYKCGLSSLTIPGSVTSISESAFRECTTLSTICYRGTQEQWQQVNIGSDNENLTNANMCFLPPLTDIIRGFWGNLSWKLDFDGTLTVIGEGVMEAFKTSIQKTPNAHYLLATEAVPQGWLEYSDYIVKVVIEEGIESISDGAFANCMNLESVFIPESVKTISDSAFVGSEKLDTINYGGTKDEWLQIGGNNLEFAPEVEVNFYGTLGDVNADGKVNNLDATMILKYDAGIIDLTPYENDVANANGDGKVNNLDASMILKYDAGLISSL